jgi:hypothetical protein
LQSKEQALLESQQKVVDGFGALEQELADKQEIIVELNR